MFEICARLGTRDDRLRRYGLLLGTLYHGCDDVADVRGTTALGGGSEKDIVDGILTLPAAVAMRTRPRRCSSAAGAARTFVRIAGRCATPCRRPRRTSTAWRQRPRPRPCGNAADPDRLVDLLRHTRALSAV